MRRRLTYLAAIVVSVAIVGATWLTTGEPLHWSKGVVVSGSCVRVEAAHFCQVELMPDRTRVRAQSEAALAGGDWVKLRVWRNLISGAETYTVVR